MHSLFSSEVHESDILEMANFGVPFLYSSTAKSYRKDYISGSLIALVGIGQVVVGALITIGSGGFAAEFGIGLAASGISDVIGGMQAAFEGRSINFQDWAKNKAIDMAVNLALSFVGAKISAAKEAKAAKTAESGLVQGSKVIANGWEFGVRLGMRVAETKLIELGTEQFVKAMARPIGGCVKELLQEIRAKFHEQNVRNNLQRICWYDSIRYQRDSFYEQKFTKQVLQSLDQKESEFGKIAQKLLSSTISQGVSSSSARIGVMVASTAYEVSKGVSEVQELVDFVKERVVAGASQGEKEIPAFGWVIANQVGGDVTQGNEIEKMLQEQGLIDSQMQVDSQKFSINQSIMSLQGQEANTTSLRGAPLGDAAISGGTTNTNSSLRASEGNTPSLRGAPLGDAAIPGGRAGIPQKLELKELKLAGESEYISLFENENSAVASKVNIERIYLKSVLELLANLKQEQDATKRGERDGKIEQLASNVAANVGSRMRGMVRSGIISPITAPIASLALNWVLNSSGLEAALSGKAAGVAAGEEVELEQDDKGKEELEKFTPWTELEQRLFIEQGIVPLRFQQEFWAEWEKKIIWPTKSIGDIKDNVSNDFLTPEKLLERGLNLPLMALSISGEVSEYLGQRVVCGVSMLPGGEYVMNVFSESVQAVKDSGKKLASWALPKSAVEKIESSYDELSHGAQIFTEDFGTGGILYGVGKLAKFGKAKLTLPKEHYEYLVKVGASKWSKVGDYIKQVPENYEFVKYTKGGDTTGLIFKNGPHNEIAIKRAKLDSDYPSQRVDYVSYKEHGNRYIAKNGDRLYVDQYDKSIIYREDAISKQVTTIPKEELQRLNVAKPEHHPDVHIPVDEFFEKFGGKK